MTKTNRTTPSRTAEDLDSSELLALLDKIDQTHDFMRSYLNAFTRGTTRELRGEQTRDNLRHLLEDLESIRKQIDVLRSKETPRLKGRVTAEVTKLVAQTQDRHLSLRGLIRDIIYSPKHKVSKSDQWMAWGLLTLMQDDLYALKRQIHADDAD